MDEEHFDGLAKIVATGGSRRAALRLLGGSALATALTRVGPHTAVGAPVGAAIDADATCRGSCAQCDGDRKCCSRRCAGGVCQCRERGPCANDRACCSGRCRGDGTCAPAPDSGCGRCQETTQRCGRDADCCGYETRERAVCREHHPAVDQYRGQGTRCCSQSGGDCKRSDQCCSDGAILSCHCGNCRNLDGENDPPCHGH